MLVKSLKCTVCGSHKVTQPQSMYIYCDYCGTWMGLDILASAKENINVFSLENMQKPEIQQYNAWSLETVELAKAKDKKAFIEIRLKIIELEFKLFPNRYGPKGRQASFQKKTLNFHNAYLEKTVNDQYFEDTYISPKQIYNLSNLSFTTKNGINYYEFDDAFKEMLDAYVEYIKKNNDLLYSDEMKDVLNIHPEGEVIKNRELMLQVGLQAMLQIYDEKTAEKAVEYLGLDDNYIEVDDIELNEYKCNVCDKTLQIPAFAKKVLCEHCGSLNNIEAREISCHNCGASFDPREKEACPYCESYFIHHHSINDTLEDMYAKANSSSTGKKKSFFRRLLGI